MAKFERQPIEVLVQGVKDFALANYNNGWCDLVVETMEDSEIADTIREGKANTVRVAIIRMRQRLSAYAEMRRSICNEAF